MGKNPAQKALQKKHTEPKREEAKAGGKKVVKTKKAAEAKTSGKREAKSCKIKGCKRTYRAKGYCTAHYKKWRNGEYGRARYKPAKIFPA